MCEKTLECGKHKCDRDCHEGPCSPCQLSVSRVSRCPCGKKLLTDLEENVDRKECTDPVPTCGAICGKKLKCGKPGSFHTCKSKCHEGPCPPCPLKTPVKCRCGSMDQNVPCVKLTAKADEVTCERQCRKYRFCGKHKCGQKCCINIDHPCPLKCNRLLSCGKHRCQDNCHRGNCERCWEASYEELTCHCGSSTIDPPVPCGTRPPACNLPCLRPQACQHPVTHMCHPEETCPPCTMLMQALCFGGHKTMKSTPCHLRAISCGDLCNRPLKCGSHKCNRVCHEGPCVPPKGKSQCPQKCMTPRACGHPCNGPCHSGPCPTISCKEKVTVTCKCGNLSTVMSCGENEKEFRALAAAKLATQLQHASNAGSSVDLGPINSKDFFKRLDCNDSCASKERANRLAVALQIENPESRGSLGTSSNPAVYSDFLKEEVRKDDQFAKMVHDALTDLVIKARDSKQKFRSHSFPPMNRDKRQFIHEYCKFFGCTSLAYDEEPKKNVVVTAQRGLSLLPVQSVLSVVLRESGLKKAPGPVWASRKGQQTPTTNGKEPSFPGLKKLEKGGSLDLESPPEPSKPVIDYFEFDE